ncbi:hypothetical protein [Aliagarivorans marinus]|uniref:hypothetical protein n=1 Tax=Aliagarivorans marinus TaxID=561965 RepID=UPI0012F76C3C|nr:hypothetical protein [Aliagarivorans marinus]
MPTQDVCRLAWLPLVSEKINDYVFEKRFSVGTYLEKQALPGQQQYCPGMPIAIDYDEAVTSMPLAQSGN